MVEDDSYSCPNCDSQRAEIFEDEFGETWFDCPECRAFGEPSGDFFVIPSEITKLEWVRIKDEADAA